MKAESPAPVPIPAPAAIERPSLAKGMKFEGSVPSKEESAKETEMTKVSRIFEEDAAKFYDGLRFQMFCSILSVQIVD